MALTVSQLAAVSYPLVLGAMRDPANQWLDTTAMKVLEKFGAIEKVDYGENIEVPLDYRSNPDSAVLATDQDQHALIKTEVLTSAVYDIAQISQAVTMTKADDVKNSSQAQKVSLVKALLRNAINTHDDLIEQLIFTSSTAGGTEFNGLDVLVPTSGTGSPGGISATTESWWVNYADTYLADGSDMEAVMTTAHNETLKGSGSNMGSKFLLSGAAPHALYESGLTSLQRFNDTNEASGGFKTLYFKTNPYAFSQYGGENVYFLNSEHYKLTVSRQAFRDKSETIPVQGQNASYFIIYTALQAVTSNKSRLAVISEA